MTDEFYVERLAPFKHLWKVDDPDWLEQRKKDWNILLQHKYADFPVDEKRELEAYFIYGEPQPYIQESSLLLLTPFTSSEEAEAFFMSDSFSASTRRDVIVRFFQLTYSADVLGWYRDHVRYFVEGVLGDKYQLMEQFEGTRMKTYSPEPTNFCQKFISGSIQVLTGEIEYIGYVECVDYFLTALPYATINKTRKRTKLEDLLEVVDQTLSNKNTTGVAKELAQNLKSREADIRANWALNAHLDG